MKNFTYTVLNVLLFISFLLPVYGQNKDLTSNQGNVLGNQSNNKSEVINPDEPLFEVKNEFGQTVFAVYPNGVKIFVDDSFKASGGGFTVGRLGTGKAISEEYFKVSPGDVRVNIYDYSTDNLKAAGGGFTVGRLGTGKSSSSDFLTVGPGNVRVNISDTQLKGTGGGFTVGRLGTGKAAGDEIDFLSVTPDSTRIAISEEGAMSNNGGFAINKLVDDRYSSEKFFKLNDNNILLGHNSGKSITTGLFNAFIGYESGLANTEGENNTFLGYHSGKLNTTGSKNVFIGEKSGYSNLSGQLNTFLGTYSGFSNLESSYSTYIGYEAGKLALSGYNTCVGYASGTLGTNGSNRAFLGFGSGNNSSGDNNTYVGAEAGFASETGDNNLFIGAGSGKFATGSRNVLIGYNSGMNFKGSDALIINNSDDVNPLIYGEFDNRLLQFNGKLGVKRSPVENQFELEGNASKTVAGSWLANSDKRIKTQITDITNASDLIMRLHPVKFKYSEEWKKYHPSIEDKFYFNFIAQEFQTVFPESVKGSGEYLGNDNNEILQIDTYNSQIVSIKAIQELIMQNQKQQAEIDDLRIVISKMDSDKKSIEDKYKEMEASINKLNNEMSLIKSLLLQSNK